MGRANGKPQKCKGLFENKKKKKSQRSKRPALSAEVLRSDAELTVNHPLLDSKKFDPTVMVPEEL